MTNWAKIAAALVAGAVLGGGLLRVRPAQPTAASGPALGAVPPQRESLLVLKHLLETRPDARTVRFVAWWPPLAVADNPFTHEPATVVRLLLKPGGAPEEAPYEPCFAYVKGDRVLGLTESPPEIEPTARPQSPAPAWAAAAQD